MVVSVIEKGLNKLKIEELNLLVAFFGNRNKVANILGVSRSRVTNWYKGDNPDLINNDKLSGLNYILNLLLSYYQPETALQWFYGQNVLIGHARPIDLIKSNRMSEIIAALRQDIAGSYA